MVAISGLVFAFGACTQDDREVEPVAHRSIDHTIADSHVGLVSPNAAFASTTVGPNNTVGPDNATRSEGTPVPDPELACQPLPWPEARKITRRNSNKQRPVKMRRGMGPSASLDSEMASSAGFDRGGMGGLGAPSGGAGKGAMGPAPARAAKKISAEFSGRSISGRSSDPAPRTRSGLLTAGEWRDLDHWSFWRGLFNSKRQGTSEWHGMQKLWGLSLRDRVSLTVRAGNKVAPNVSVYLYDKDGNTAWKARSDNQGQVHLFPQWKKGPFSVCAAVKGEASKQVNVELSKGLAALEVGLQSESAVSNGLDVMFMVDTTGSMGDELSYLQTELRNVISRVQDANANADIRTSVNFYRDSTDEYVVRPFPFTRDVQSARKHIAAQSANGGGDFPEAVDAALTSAIFEHKWREDARARILFLVLDAPPHQEKKTLARVRRATRQAAEQGIRIVPIAGSGIDKPTEFLMRFLAVATGGTYAFLTDDSGIGNSHLKPTIGKHKVQKLNRLLANIINRYAE